MPKTAPIPTAPSRQLSRWDRQLRFKPERSVREVAAEYNRRHGTSLSAGLVSNIERHALNKLSRLLAVEFKS